MLSLGRKSGYVHEPFVLAQPSTPINDWFYYVHDGLPKKHIEELNSYLARFFQPQVKRLLYDLKNVQRIRSKGRLIRDYFRFLNNRFFCDTIIMKDPIAILSAKWIEENYNAKVVIVVRHPLAFAGSLKKGNTTFDFNHLIRQTRLMGDHLMKYEKLILEFATQDKPIVEQAALLWNILYGTTFKLYKNNPNWIIVTHEELSLDPVERFSELYNKLDIPFSDYERSQIIKFTSKNGKKSISRNSRENIVSWKNRLSAEEIKAIYELLDKENLFLYDESNFFSD